MTKSFYRRRICVLCDSKDIKDVLSLKKTPLANSYPVSQKIKEEYFPLTTTLCKSCGHLQLKEIVNPKKMFTNYLYVSGTSKVLVNHFKNYCSKMVSKFKLKKNVFILDIACNDGTFLECFVKKKFKNVVGVEPAKNLRKINKEKNIKINTIFFNEENSKILYNKYKKFKLITANNVFAHVPDLKSFALGVKNSTSSWNWESFWTIISRFFAPFVLASFEIYLIAFFVEIASLDKISFKFVIRYYLFKLIKYTLLS